LPGSWFSLEVLDPTILSIKQTHLDPGIVVDLAAIQNESDAWYALYTTHNSKSYVTAVAAWVETQAKIYLADVNETAAITTVVLNATDTLAVLFSLAYKPDSGLVLSSPAAMFGGAWLGSVLPDDPGSETWKFRTLSGVRAGHHLTDTHRVNLRARKANTYTIIAGENKTWEGTVAGGPFGFIDHYSGPGLARGRYGQGCVWGDRNSRRKIPYTTAGIAFIRSEVKASLKRAASRGIIADDFDIQSRRLPTSPRGQGETKAAGRPVLRGAARRNPPRRHRWDGLELRR